MKLFRNKRYLETSYQIQASMKPTSITLICSALLLAGTLLRGEDRPAKRTFGNGVLPEYLAVYDADDSGSLSVEEGQVLRADRAGGGRLETFRSKWDANTDGTISDAEREIAKATIRQLIIGRRCRRFEEVDTDEDGFLSTTEFRAIAAVLSVDNTSPGTATDLFNHLDHNNDDAISKAEFLRSLDAAPTQSVDVKPSPVHPDPVSR